MTDSSGCTSSAEIRQQMAEIAQRMFERKLLDMAGGNISVRFGEKIIISPRYAGSNRHWQLRSDDFVEGDIDNDRILSAPCFSREGKAHLGVYRNYPSVHGIIHAHAFHIMPFAAMKKPIPPVLEATQMLGTIPVIPYALSNTDELAHNVVEGLRNQQEAMQFQAAAVLMPLHGILVAGKDLWAAVDVLERIDWNCWCILAMKYLE